MTTTTATTQSFTSDTPNRTNILIALMCVYVIWGSTYFAVAVALNSFTAFPLGVVRFGLTSALLFGYLLLYKRQALPTGRQIINAMIVGGLTLGVGTGAVAFAEQTVSSGLAALAVAAVPLWTALFAVLLFKRPTRWEWVGLLVGFSGIVLLNLDKGLGGSTQGALALIIGPICWALGSILSKRLDMPSGFMAIAFEALSACLLMLLASLLTGSRMPEAPTLNAWLAIIYLATVGSLIGFTAYIYLLDNVRPTVATSYAYVNPVVALLLGVLFLGEGKSVTPITGVAMVIILGGVVVVGWAANRPTAATGE